MISAPSPSPLFIVVDVPEAYDGSSSQGDLNSASIIPVFGQYEHGQLGTPAKSVR
jgi:hypothetical protein